MRKKYLSALLFGALLFASAGTFTSCKDYDDDISNLQGQINDVNTAITELQSAVEGGKYVTAVSNTGNTITFTFSDGTTTQVALEDQVGSVVTVQDGVLYIDGEATDIKVAEPAPTPEPGEEHKDQIIIENNMWSVLQEDGTYKTTNIPVSGVSVSGSEAEGFTFRVYASDGTYKDVKLPTATSSLTDLILTEEGTDLEYYKYNFQYNNSSSDAGAPARDKWAGPRALPAKDGSLVAGMTTIPVQLNPTTVDGTVIDFSLVDSKNNVPSNITLTAKADNELKTRTASANGLYTLSMEDVYFDDNQKLSTFEGQFTASGNEKAYAVMAGQTRSIYDVAVKAATTGKTLTNVNVVNGSTKIGSTSVGANSSSITVDPNTWYKVTVDDDAALYDMHLSVNSNDKTLYGVEIEESEGSFTFRTTTTPDNITKPTFNLIVETVDKNGTYKKTTLVIQQSAIITSGVTYDPISYEIKNKNVGENYFYVSLDKMKEALGSQGVALWNTKAKLASTAVKFVDTTDKTIVLDESDGINATFVNKNENNVTEVTKLSDANFIQFRIDNATAGGNFDVNKQYNAVIDFKENATSVLNTITVPFTLTLPSITTLFQLDANFVIDGNAVCYMYAGDQTSGEAAFKLNRVFAKAETTGFTIELDNTTEVIDKMKSNQLATIDSQISGSTASSFDASTMVTLKNSDGSTNLVDGKTGLQKGYGQVLTFHITGKYANAWEYPEGEGFTFTAKILSPIYEGSVTPREGSQVVIPASDLEGYQFGNDVIIGNTYNTAVTYDVLPIWKNSASVYSREDIKAVSAKSGNTNIFTIESTPTAAQSPITSGNTTVKRDGYFEMHSQNVPQTSTTTVEITVTDIWGYSKTSSVPVQITVE